MWFLLWSRRRGGSLHAAMAGLFFGALIICSLVLGLAAGKLIVETGYSAVLAILGGLAGAAFLPLVLFVIYLVGEVKWRIYVRRREQEAARRHAAWKAKQEAIRLPETEVRNLCLEARSGGSLLRLSSDEASLELKKLLTNRYNPIVAKNHVELVLAIWQELSDLLQEVLEQVDRQAEVSVVMPQVRQILEERVSLEEAKRLTNIAFHCL